MSKHKKILKEVQSKKAEIILREKKKALGGLDEEALKALALVVGKKYGGQIENYSFHSTYKSIRFLMGIIVTDPTHRFMVGHTIRTSHVKDIHLEEGYIITANTVYMLVGERNPNPLPDNLASRIYF